MNERIAEQLTVMLITHNEAPNIARCLEALRWVPRILIIDSGSTDETIAIAGGFPQVKILQRPFDNFASQCNFGLAQVRTPWVMSMDADYLVTPELQAEIQRLQAGGFVAWEVGFVYCIQGRPLRSTLYPPRKVLYQTDRACYHNLGHSHRVEIAGPVGRLTGRILHDDRKPLSRWFASQQSYAQLEAAHLLNGNSSTMRVTDRIRRMAWPAPPLVFVYTLFAKRCLLDGWTGWFYVLQRTLAELLIALAIIDRRLALRTTGRESQ